jgi:enoyl-CoA hydratase
MFEVDVSGSVASVTMNRAPVNAMNDAWVEGLHKVLDDLNARDDWSVLRLRSALKLFSGGADLKQIDGNFNLPIAQQAGPGQRYQALFARIEAIERLTFAEIKGMALGGGLELALACDLRFASDEAKLGLPEVTLGLIPGAGGTQRLPRLCGRATAMRMIMSGELVSGAQALALGLVQWAAPQAEFDERVEAVIKKFASIAPHAARAAKLAINAGFESGRDGFEAETEGVLACLGHPRTRELVGAFLARGTK